MFQVLTDAQLRSRAPSIFAESPHSGVSARYGHVPTIALLNAFRDVGWYPVRAEQTRVRDVSRRAHTRHLVRLRRVRDPIEVGDSLAELVLLNSHDGSSAYQLDIGLYRLVCENGMVTPIGETGGIRVRHGKHVVDEAIEGSYDLVEEVPRIAAQVDQFRALSLSPRESERFARSALELRYGEDWSQASPVTTAQVLSSRRVADSGQDLWSTLNRVQENLTKGGLAGRSRSGRRTRTRAIRSVTEDVRLNRALWRLTERFTELKAAA
jgi:hypothetical protein